MGNLRPAKACANSQLVPKPVFLRSSSNPINTRTALNAIFQAEDLVLNDSRGVRGHVTSKIVENLRTVMAILVFFEQFKKKVCHTFYP